MIGKIAEQWKKDIDTGNAYHYEIRSLIEFYIFKLKPCSVRLKRIIKLGRINPGMKIMDFGAGGGRDSIPLAYMGYEVEALDCSDAVVKNLMTYKISVEKFSGRKLNIKTNVVDILEANLPENGYDVIFSCGVMEHFIDDEERRKIYNILSKSLKKNGILITFVPNGNHPLRFRQKAEKLGGYNIPEIDYTIGTFEKDIEGAELFLDKVEGFDLFGYVSILPEVSKSRIIRLIIRSFYIIARLSEPLIPSSIKKKHGFWVVFVAKRK